MKCTLLLFFSSFFWACSDNNQKTIVNNNQTDSIKAVFTPIFKGVWVISDYIKAIEKTKSPIKASVKLNGIVTMIFDQLPSNDSMEIGASWNNHEGYNFISYFKMGHRNNSIATNLHDYDENSNVYELGFEIIKEDTFLYLYHLNQAHQLLDKVQFTKVAEKQNDHDAGWGIQHIVIQKIFAGKTLWLDSANSFSSVTLNNDGTLLGHPDFKTFYVSTDFMGGPETTIDGIIFNLSSTNPRGFAFESKKDTLFLYNTIGEEEEGTLVLDKVQYRIIKEE